MPKAKAKDEEVTKDEYGFLEEDEDEVVKPDDLTEGFIAESDPKSKLKNMRAYQDMEPVDVIGTSLDKFITKLGRATAEELNKKPKMKVMLPKNDRSPQDTYAVASINSWVFQVARGVPMLLPAEIIDLFADGGYNPTLVR
jgi:hypothetical protein